MLLASSAMVTNAIITVHHAYGLPGPNPGSAPFLGMLWPTTVFMGLVCGLMFRQWKLERGGGCRNETCTTRVHSAEGLAGGWKSGKDLP
jgi:hypothetical protein